MRDQSGFSMVELLVSLVILVFAVMGLAGLMIQNAQINKSQQMTQTVHSNARNCLSLIVSELRSAGWDPLYQNINVVVLDPDDNDADDTDGVDDLEVYADLLGDGDTDDIDEQVRIRHSGDQILWRRQANLSYIVLAENISNDADGDGTAEPMFLPDTTPTPSRITVQVTAESPAPDPVTGQIIRYTVRSDVTLRKQL
ncbi:MAG: prepilin-type N-terminal cleavage/methylation domain-containing protein [Acidobacteriota bacterium]|nr:prepilin-type N-terminal cleavage/methylation domain-containing protein [Acidobacteriota bacterium]